MSADELRSDDLTLEPVHECWLRIRSDPERGSFAVSAASEVDGESRVTIEILDLDPLLAQREQWSQMMEHGNLTREARFGRRLAQAALGDARSTVRQHVIEFLGDRTHRSRLRISVLDDDKALVGIPWEYLFLPQVGDDDENAERLVLRDRTAIVREHPRPRSSMREVLGVPRLLHFLAPEVGDAAVLDGREGDELHDRLSHGRAHTNLVQDRSCSHRSLRARLSQQWDVFIFSGHGSPDGIFLADGDDSVVVSGSALGTMLADASVQLAIINACDGAAQGTAENVVAEVAASGVPHVIGMQGPVSDPHAAAFILALCETLADEGTLDDAVREGRTAMSNRGHYFEYGLPVQLSPPGIDLRFGGSPMVEDPSVSRDRPTFSSEVGAPLRRTASAEAAPFELIAGLRISREPYLATWPIESGSGLGRVKATARLMPAGTVQHRLRADRLDGPTSALLAQLVTDLGVNDDVTVTYMGSTGSSLAARLLAAVRAVAGIFGLEMTAEQLVAVMGPYAADVSSELGLSIVDPNSLDSRARWSWKPAMSGILITGITKGVSRGTVASRIAGDAEPEDALGVHDLCLAAEHDDVDRLRAHMAGANACLRYQRSALDVLLSEMCAVGDVVGIAATTSEDAIIALTDDQSLPQSEVQRRLSSTAPSLTTRHFNPVLSSGP